MKRLLIILSLLCLLAPAPARADIVPKDMKTIFISAVLENIAEYPQYVFINVQTLGNEIRHKAVIEPDGIVHKLYKFNELHILAIPKELFDQQGGLDHFDLLNSPDAIRYTGKLESGQVLHPRPTTLSGKKVYYRIISIGVEGIRLERTREEQFFEHPNHFPLNLFAIGFGISLAVELIVFMIMVRFVLRSREPKALRAIVSVAVAQIVTLPLLWYLISRYGLVGPVTVAGAETFAVVSETVVYRFLARLSWNKAFIAALVCNAFSFITGLMA